MEDAFSLSSCSLVGSSFLVSSSSLSSGISSIFDIHISKAERFLSTSFHSVQVFAPHKVTIYTKHLAKLSIIVLYTYKLSCLFSIVIYLAISNSCLHILAYLSSKIFELTCSILITYLDFYIFFFWILRIHFFNFILLQILFTLH